MSQVAWTNNNSNNAAAITTSLKKTAATNTSSAASLPINNLFQLCQPQTQRSSNYHIATAKGATRVITQLPQPAP